MVASPTLYDLSSSALVLQTQIQAAAEDLFSDDPAEVTAATNALEQLITAEACNRRALAAKADAWCWVIDHLRAQAATRKHHAERLLELAKQTDHQADVLQHRLTTALQRVDPDATTWNLPEHKLTSRSSTAVEIDPDLQPWDLPVEYQRVKTSVSTDKTALKAALKAGHSIDGVQLVTSRSWRIH